MNNKSSGCGYIQPYGCPYTLQDAQRDKRKRHGNGLREAEKNWRSNCRLDRLPIVRSAVSVYQPALAGMLHFRNFEKNICYNNNCSLFLTHDDKNDEHYKAYEEASQQREGFRIVLCVKIISEGLPRREGFFYYNIY